MYIYIYNSWNIDCDPGFHGFFFVAKNNHQAVKKMELIEIEKHEKVQQKTVGISVM